MSRRGREPVAALPADVWQQIQRYSYRDKHAALRQQMTLLRVSKALYQTVNQAQCWRALFDRFWQPQPQLAWKTQRQVLRMAYQTASANTALLKLMRKQATLYDAAKGHWLWKACRPHSRPTITYMRKLVPRHMLPKRRHRVAYTEQLRRLEGARTMHTRLQRRYQLKKVRHDAVVIDVSDDEAAIQ